MTTVSAVSIPRNGDILKSTEYNNREDFTETDGRDFKKESERLASFTGWSCSYVTPASLAKVGFYYTKKDDLVKCAYCGIEIGKWEPGDDALRDHKKWSPDCPYVKNMSTPIGPEDPTGQDTCGRYGIEIRPNSVPENEPCTSSVYLKKLGIPINRGPSYPNYAVFENRLLTFSEWPTSMKQKPRDLADAGFFYTGKGDQTICFHCGGGLKNWEENDDPWEQHALWFSKCNYLLLKKSPEFVKTVFSKKTEQTKDEVAEAKKELPKSVDVPVKQDETKESDSSNSSTLCKICFTKEVGVVFLPCGHVVACVDCAPALSNCAVCRKPLEATFRAFLS